MAEQAFIPATRSIILLCEDTIGYMNDLPEQKAITLEWNPDYGHWFILANNREIEDLLCGQGMVDEQCASSKNPPKKLIDTAINIMMST